eukprot:jgi/Bigna1/82533/fgenesh1_pg.93_\
MASRVGPESGEDEKLRWAPIVFYDEFSYGKTTLSSSTGRHLIMMIVCAFEKDRATCAARSPTRVATAARAGHVRFPAAIRAAAAASWNLKRVYLRCPSRLFTANELGFFGDKGNAPLLSYAFKRKEDGSGFESVEIFRNAYAVDLYHSQIPFKLDCCLLLELFTLPCRQGPRVEMVYGDPEECKRVGSYLPESKTSENNRCESARQRGKLRTWKDEFQVDTPTASNLLEKFGPFHYGWRHQPSVTERLQSHPTTTVTATLSLGCAQFEDHDWHALVLVETDTATTADFQTPSAEGISTFLSPHPTDKRFGSEASQRAGRQLRPKGPANSEACSGIHHKHAKRFSDLTQDLHSASGSDDTRVYGCRLWKIRSSSYCCNTSLQRKWDLLGWDDGLDLRTAACRRFVHILCAITAKVISLKLLWFSNDHSPSLSQEHGGSSDVCDVYSFYKAGKIKAKSFVFWLGIVPVAGLTFIAILLYPYRPRVFDCPPRLRLRCRALFSDLHWTKHALIPHASRIQEYRAISLLIGIYGLFINVILLAVLVPWAKTDGFGYVLLVAGTSHSGRILAHVLMYLFQALKAAKYRAAITCLLARVLGEYLGRVRGVGKPILTRNISTDNIIRETLWVFMLTIPLNWIQCYVGYILLRRRMDRLNKAVVKLEMDDLQWQCADSSKSSFELLSAEAKTGRGGKKADGERIPDEIPEDDDDDEHDDENEKTSSNARDSKATARGNTPASIRAAAGLRSANVSHTPRKSWVKDVSPGSLIRTTSALQMSLAQYTTHQDSHDHFRSNAIVIVLSGAHFKMCCLRMFIVLSRSHGVLRAPLGLD